MNTHERKEESGRTKHPGHVARRSLVPTGRSHSSSDDREVGALSKAGSRAEGRGDSGRRSERHC